MAIDMMKLVAREQPSPRVPLRCNTCGMEMGAAFPLGGCYDVSGETYRQLSTQEMGEVHKKALCSYTMLCIQCVEKLNKWKADGINGD